MATTLMMKQNAPLGKNNFIRSQFLARLIILINIMIILNIGKLFIEQQQQQQQRKRQVQNHPIVMQKLLSKKESNTTNDINDRLRSILKCNDHYYDPQTIQRGDYWVLKNYVRAGHGELKCHESITYTTHADYTYLDNLIPLLDRWRAPVSIALHAPGTDFQPTLNAISYLRDCLPESNLVRMYTTFHIFFIRTHIPKNLPHYSEALSTPYNCSLPAPYVNVSSDQLYSYKTQEKLVYSINVARNIALEAALTHFILSADIELYPSTGLVESFLTMIARNESYQNRKLLRVFPLVVFEVVSNAFVPRNKTELLDFLRTGKAVPFHTFICPRCHTVPHSEEWMAANETDGLSVFHIGKRTGAFWHWEPFFIGTHDDPLYDERLTWDGKFDKMTQAFVLCALDYEFHILDNAFLVHRPGIKMPKKDAYRDMMNIKTAKILNKFIYPELRKLYGTRKECHSHENESG